MKRKFLVVLFICLIINIVLISMVIIPAFKEKKELKKIKEAKVNIVLNNNLKVPFLSEVKVSDFISDINGVIIDDYEINTTEVGEQKVEFEYINDEDIKIPFSYNIDIVDDVAPVIWLGDSYSVYTDYDGDLLQDIVCADNYDDNPHCEILGEYDTTKVGKYNLVFKAVDASNNVTVHEFVLNVKERPKESGNGTSTNKPSYTYIEDVIKNYKNEKTKIGIDVSSWQGNIDFEAVKNAGIEFVFIRVGSSTGIEGDYFVDKTFIRNIEGFKKVGIPVGIYFYSYANSMDRAVQDAQWVLNQVKDYNIDLPIAYDWESWSFYNEFHQSFYSLTKSAKSFLDTIKDAGYTGALYSSKNYLERVWYDTGYPVWLAHYTDQTNYEGNFKYWQLCSNGQVPGIYGNVDINIMYE